MKLDIACGNNKPEGYKGIDISPDSQADIVHNLMSFPWPIKDNSIDEIICSHYIEHIPHGDGYHDPFFQFFDEVYRILKPKAKAQFIAPYYASVRSFQDPSHQRGIAEPTFLYLSKKWRKLNKLEHYPVHCNFDATFNYGVNSMWQGKSDEAMQHAAMSNINVIDDIHITLIKK